RARQPVDLVDHDHIDQTGIDILDETLEARALQRAAGEAAVIVAFANGGPAFRLLTRHKGLASLALGVEAVELHVEPFLARLSGIDGAALAARNDRNGFLMTAHRSSLRASRRPKKR